mgnify:CR=1 FL=1
MCCYFACCLCRCCERWYPRPLMGAVGACSTKTKLQCCGFALTFVSLTTALRRLLPAATCSKQVLAPLDGALVGLGNTHTHDHNASRCTRKAHTSPRIVCTHNPHTNTTPGSCTRTYPLNRTVNSASGGTSTNASFSTKARGSRSTSACKVPYHDTMPSHPRHTIHTHSNTQRQRHSTALQHGCIL